MEKLTHKNHLKPLCLIILGFLMINLIGVSLISAWDFDNVKGDLIIDETTSRYGKVEIRNSVLGIPFLQLDLVSEIELLKNTNTCGRNCYAEGRSILYEEGILIDSLRANPRYDDINNFEVFIGGKISTITEYDYWSECSEKQTLNGTKYKECITKATPRQEQIIEWLPYNNQELKVGTYNWRIEGTKNKYDNTDWWGTFQNVELDIWINWTGVTSDGLMFYSNMSTGSGTGIVDSSLQSGNGTFLGSTGMAWTEGKYDNAIYMSTSASGINISGNKTTGIKYIDNNITVEAWIKTNQTGATYHQIVNHAGNYVIAVNGGNLVEYPSGGNGGSVADDTWHHIAFVVNGGNNTGCFYIDGGTATCFTKSLSTVATSVLVGVNNGGTENFGGLMDEIKIWNITRTQAEIKSDMLENAPGIIVTLVLPPDKNINLTSKRFIFNCSVTTQIGKIQNITLYGNWSGEWHSNETLDVTSQNSNSVMVTFNKSLEAGTYDWNCLAWNNDTSIFATVNRTVTSSGWIENSQTYVANTLEGVTNDFVIDVNYIPIRWNLISGTLTYNKTAYPGTKTGIGSNAIFTSSVAASNVNNEKNISFYWTIGLTDEIGTYYFNTTTYNQTVSIINMSLCGQPYTTPFMNFTIYDEATFLELNGTIDLTFIYRGYGSTVSNIFSYTQTNTTKNSTYDFCIDPPHQNYTIDSILSYDAEDYAQRFYNFEGITFTNTTTEIGLYLLNDTSSTSFLVVVQDENYQPLADVEVYMQIYHAGNWETVEIATTNDDGETINHIYTEDSIYRFKIYDDGTLLHTTTGSIISCPSTPCTVTITITEEIPRVLEIFEDLENLITTLTYDESTEVIRYTYTDTSSNFTRGRIYVIRFHPGEINISYVCNETNSIATAVLTCDLTGLTNGTYIATGYITRNSDEVMVERKIFSKIRDIVGIIGLDGVLWSIFLLIGIIMMGVYRPSLGIIFGGVGVVLMWMLQLMEITITALVALIGIAIILLIEVRKE